MAIIYFLRGLYDQSLTLTGSNKLKLLTALLALLTYKYRSHAIGTRRRDDLKEPKGAVPFLGHMLLMASTPGTKLHDLFLRHYRELGPVWSISLPGIGRMIQGDSPELVEHVNKTNSWAYAKGEHFNVALGDIFGKGIITTDGDEWKSRRKQTMQVFNVKVFREYSSDIFNTEAQKVIDYLGMAASSGAVVDFQQIMQAFTLDAFGNILFGESFGCLDNIDHKVSISDSISDLLGISSDRLVDPMWKIRETITGVGTRNRVKANKLRQHVREIIAKNRSDGVEERISCDQKKRNLLMLFMEFKNEHGELVDDEYIVDIILNLTIAARDPTAEALAWMLYSLLREETDPEIMKTLVREVDEVLGDELPTFETHKKQKYAEACFFETLRIFPTLPRMMRLCTKDDILPDGTKIHAGEIFSWSGYVMGRSEKIWGPDVADFKPSRWLGSAGEKQASLNKAMPFHVGPRACFGQWFVVMQSLTIMGLVLRKFELQLVEPGKMPAYGVGMTLPMIEGLPIQVARRRARGDDNIDA